MSFINYNQCKIAFETTGKGKTLVFLHGFCENLHVWDDFIKRFEDYQIIRIDLPGFGQSDLLENLSMAGMADAVKAVLDELGVENATIIGHSMGGYVALSFLEQYESYVEELVLFHSHPYADEPENKLSRQKSIDFIQKHGHEIYLKQLFPALFTKNFVGSNTFLMEKLTHGANKLPSENIMAALKAMMQRKDRSALLKNLDIPVLFIVGAADQVVGKKQSMGAVNYPNISSIALLENVGHMGMFENPKKCTKVLKDFLEFCKVEAECIPSPHNYHKN